MSKNSPLLQRACKESIKRNFRIPGRGRIRFVLFLIFACIGFWLYKSHRVSSDNNDSRNSILSESKKPKKPTLKVKNVKREKRVKVKRPGKLSVDGVADLIRRFPLCPSCSKDTIQFKDGAFIVHYSIDSTLQRLGKNFLKQYRPKYGAVAVIEPPTGRVLSLISYTRDGELLLGKNLFCRNMFPAASIFKIVTAAGAIEKGGLKAESKLRTLGSNHTLYNSQLVKNPKNFREVTLQEAFAYSINPVFGRIGLFLLGADGLMEYALKFGFNSRIPFELDNEKPVFIYPDTGFAIAELASGFNQETTISPLFGAMIAAGISNHGHIFAPTIVDSITDLASKKNMYTRKSVLWRMPIQPRTAAQLVILMQDVARYGTARKSFRYLKQSYRFKEIDYGGKTGSVDKEGIGKVDWFVGFCRHRNDKTQHIATGVVTVHGEQWTVHSSFIGAEMMRKYLRKIQITKTETKERQLDSLAIKAESTYNSVYVD